MEYFWNGWKFNPACCLAYVISKALGMPIERYNSSIEVRDEKPPRSENTGHNESYCTKSKGGTKYDEA